MMAAMERAGAVPLNAAQIDRLTKAAFAEVGEGAHKHLAPTKDMLGQDAVKLAAAAGVTVDPKVELVFGETSEDHPFVSIEQMMPFVPFVRCRDVDHAIQLAKHYEHGYRHTSMIHSRDVHNT